jgi:hypothetical protein
MRGFGISGMQRDQAFAEMRNRLLAGCTQSPNRFPIGRQEIAQRQQKVASAVDQLTRRGNDMTGSSHHKPKLVTDRERRSTRKGTGNYVPTALIDLDRLLRGKRRPKKNGNGKA